MLPSYGTLKEETRRNNNNYDPEKACCCDDDKYKNNCHMSYCDCKWLITLICAIIGVIIIVGGMLGLIIYFIAFGMRS